MYHQKQFKFYSPKLVKFNLGEQDVTVNYVEKLDESCVEYQHVHDFYEIYYCMTGIHNLTIGDKVVTLTANTFAILKPGIHHHTVYEPNLIKRYVVFCFLPTASSGNKGHLNHDSMQFWKSFNNYFKENDYIICRDKYNCGSILLSMREEFMNNLPGRDMIISALYQQYIVNICRHFLSKNLPIVSEESRGNNNLTIEITKYLHANYNKNISIQDISEKFYISTRHLNRIFEDFFGESFKRTLNIYRVNYAKNYLIDTDYSMDKITELVGFSSTKSLNKFFAEMEGIKPSEYRRLYKDG